MGHQGFLPCASIGLLVSNYTGTEKITRYTNAFI